MSEPSFRFRLGTVLRVARIHEDEGQRLMAQESTAEQAAHARTRECADAYAACTVTPTDTAYAQIAVDDFRTRAATAALRAHALRTAQADGVLAQERVAAARDEVIARVSRRRSLEELESRHRALHAEDAARAAQRALDDLSQLRRSAR